MGISGYNYPGLAGYLSMLFGGGGMGNKKSGYEGNL